MRRTPALTSRSARTAAWGRGLGEGGRTSSASARLTCRGERGHGGGEGEGCCGRGSRTFHGPAKDRSVVSADGRQAGSEPIGRVVDDVFVMVGPALVDAGAGWETGPARGSRTARSPRPQTPDPSPTWHPSALPARLCVHRRPPAVHSLGRRRGDAEGPARPAPLPAPPPTHRPPIHQLWQFSAAGTLAPTSWYFPSSS